MMHTVAVKHPQDVMIPRDKHLLLLLRHRTNQDVAVPSCTRMYNSTSSSSNCTPEETAKAYHRSPHAAGKLRQRLKVPFL
jgi:hypothetical protein